VPTGKAVLRSCANALRPALLELGGKNALIAMPDSRPDEIAAAVINGMNFTWCGQSCGSTSRAFIHADIYDAVLALVPSEAGRFKPGLPSDPTTTMGPLVNKVQYDRVKQYIDSAKQAGARLVCGGGAPADEALKDGFFLEPTVFADVSPLMAIAQEEIFGPVLSIIKWSDEAEMIRQVNGTQFGLTAAVWSNDTTTAHRIALQVQAGWIWINDVGRHALGSPFGGYKQSGLGREESIQELMEFTQEKNILINLAR
jgi:betaine-aldehyde dehydrogenase